MLVLLVYYLTSLNIFKQLPPETNGPIALKFHMATPWDGGTNVCSNGRGHTLKSSSPEPEGR